MKSFALLFCLLLFAPLHAQSPWVQAQVTVDAVGDNVDTQTTQALKLNLEDWFFAFTTPAKAATPKYPMELQLNVELLEKESQGFRANVQLTAFRPLYGKTEQTPILRLYEHASTLEWSLYTPLPAPTNHLSNHPLALRLAYYTYLCLALYYDAVAPEAGDPFWLQLESLFNRLTILDTTPYKQSILPQELASVKETEEMDIFREAWYEYHRQVLDQQLLPADTATRLMTVALKWKAIQQKHPTFALLRVLAQMKTTEVNTLYQQLELPQQRALYPILSTLFIIQQQP